MCRFFAAPTSAPQEQLEAPDPAPAKILGSEPNLKSHKNVKKGCKSVSRKSNFEVDALIFNCNRANQKRNCRSLFTII